jgi:DNA-binding winged helix-turn-helix (wHTH) protein
MPESGDLRTHTPAIAAAIVDDPGRRGGCATLRAMERPAPAPARETTPRRGYRFDAFVLSPGRRALLRAGRIVPLIPRYLDLLLLLVERRHQAVHRHAIFDAVWSDVVVSEGALTQAVRSLRRALEDDPREPRFIRTVSRHGYQFVFPAVEELDEAEVATPPAEPAADPVAPTPRSTETRAATPPSSSTPSARRRRSAVSIRAQATSGRGRSSGTRVGMCWAPAASRSSTSPAHC